MASTNDELKVLVQEYVKTNKDTDTEIGRHLQKHYRFKDCMPGDEWVASFMKKYDLSKKNPALEKNIKLTEQNPNTIYQNEEKKSFIQLLSNTLMKRQDAAPKAGKPNRKRKHNQSVILTCDVILKDLEEPTTSEPKQKDQKKKRPQNLQQDKDLLHRQIQHLHPRLKLWNLTIHLL